MWYGLLIVVSVVGLLCCMMCFLLSIVILLIRLVSGLSWWVIRSMVWLVMVLVSELYSVWVVVVFRFLVGLFSSRIGVFLSRVWVIVRWCAWLLERCVLDLFNVVL